MTVGPETPEGLKALMEDACVLGDALAPARRLHAALHADGVIPLAA